MEKLVNVFLLSHFNNKQNSNIYTDFMKQIYILGLEHFFSGELLKRYRKIKNYNNIPLEIVTSSSSLSFDEIICFWHYMSVTITQMCRRSHYGKHFFEGNEIYEPSYYIKKNGQSLC